jgi:hypothetical protein
MNWKGCGRKRSWPSLNYYLGIRLERPRKTTKAHSQNSRSSDRNLNPGLTDYEARVLTTRPQRSIPHLSNIAKKHCYEATIKSSTSVDFV